MAMGLSSLVHQHGQWVYYRCLIVIATLTLIYSDISSDGHGPGWADSVSVPLGSGSIWNLIRMFSVLILVPNDSLAVQGAVPPIPTPRLGGSDHRFHFSFYFKYNIKVL